MSTMVSDQIASAYTALGRRAGRATALGFKAARVQRESGTQPSGGSGDYHLRSDRELLGRCADAFMRDSGIYKGILSRFVDAVLGPNGFTLDPQTASKRVNDTIKRRWARFSEKPEIRGMFSWQDAERLALTAVANQGDVGAIHTTRRLFQFVESEELTGGKLSDGNRLGRMESGVELDEFGAPLAFNVAPRSDYGQVLVGNGRRIVSENFTFAANRERFSQTRGVPILASTFAMVHRITDVCDSEAIAWQSLAKFALAITRENSPELGQLESVADDDGIPSAANSGTNADLADRMVELEEAIIFYARPGESVSAIQRTLPGRDFPESVRMFLRLIGLPIGLPLEVILLDYSKTNYSSARASLEQAYRMFVVWQAFLQRTWHVPLYRQWIRWEVESGDLPERADIYDHQWITSQFPWVDHLKEAEAWGMRLDRGLATQAMALRSINMDIDNWRETRAREIADATVAAKAIRKQHPDGLDLETLIRIMIAQAPTKQPSEPVAAEGVAEPVGAPTEEVPSE